MTDHDHPDEPEFDDPSYDAIRGLLASARETGPVPDDVAARLDVTLASLTADRRSAVPADVVPLRRRSRLAPRLLAAAAAVVVVGAGGIGISQVLSTQDSADMATADSAQPERAEGTSGFGPLPAAPTPVETAPESGDADFSYGNRLLGSLASKAVPRFTTAAFARQAAAFGAADLARLGAPLTLGSTSKNGENVVEENGPGRITDSAGTPTPTGPTRGTAGGIPADGLTSGTKSSPQTRYQFFATAKAACPGPAGSAATIVPILYDGKRAALAVYPRTTKSQLFVAWTCDGRTVLASAVVPR